MHKLMIVLAVTVLGSSAVASEQTDVMAPVQQFVEGFNRGDTKMAERVCTHDTLIIDDFPPNVWQGAGATSRWLNDYEAYAKSNGITDGTITLGKPSHIDVAGIHAYVVVPVTLALKKKGNPVSQPGVMTIALRQDANRWRIAGWAWADG